MISVVVPCYNEQEVLPQLHTRLAAAAAQRRREAWLRRKVPIPGMFCTGRFASSLRFALRTSVIRITRVFPHLNERAEVRDLAIAMQGSSFHIGNLSCSFAKEQLRELFSCYGEVDDVILIEEKGVGFTEMSGLVEVENNQRVIGRYHVHRPHLEGAQGASVQE